jgi:uncharacterized paraquat-inducible protein A
MPVRFFCPHSRDGTYLPSDWAGWQGGFMWEPNLAAVVYCALVAAVFLGLWWHYDRRDQLRYDGERRKATFHCIRCDTLHAEAQATETCRCPRCGHENARLRF